MLLSSALIGLLVLLFHPLDLPLDQLISIQTDFLKPIYASSGMWVYWVCQKRQSVRCVCNRGVGVVGVAEERKCKMCVCNRGVE